MKKAIWFLILGLALALGLFVGMQTPQAYADPTPGWAVQLPILGYLGNTGGGDLIIEVQNVGADFAKAELYLWGAYSGFCEPQAPGPAKVECSGLLKPGSAWIWTEAQIPSYARSGIVYAVDECLGNAVNQPLAVEVIRKFPGMDGDISSAYSGISGQMEGVYDPVFGGYAYYAPIVYAQNGGLDSWLYIQNSGDQCTSVELWFKQQDDCLRAQICEVLALAPGETVAYPASSCVGPGFLGSVWIRTSQPTGIIVDQKGDNVLMTYHAKPAELSYVFNGTPYYTAGSEVAYGPLMYREEYGWDSKVYVQNLSSITAAKVKVYFLDNSGDIITTLVDWVCPRGNQTFFLAMVNNLPGNYHGQIRVESQEWWSPGDPKVLAPNIQAVAELIKYAGPARDEPLEAMAYTLFPEDQAFDWEVGQNPDFGTRLIAIPSLHKRGSVGLSSELSIANVNPNPGFTDFAIYIYDQNGLHDFVCEKLNEKQIDYINLDSWGYVNSGFKGSAVIWGTYTTQPGGFGLAAVKVERSNTVLGVDIPGDESAASEGFPIYGPFDFEGPQIPVCPGEPEPCVGAVASTVYDHDGNPVPSALVQIFEVGKSMPTWTGTTDEGGHFTASLPAAPLPGVLYRVEINGVTAIFSPLLLPESYTTRLFCGQQAVWRIRLPGLHTIDGYAKESCWFSAPYIAKLMGATVELWWDNVKVASTTTNSEGYFKFSNVTESLSTPYHVKICFKDNAGNTVCFETQPFMLDSMNLRFWFHYDSVIPDDSYWCPFPVTVSVTCEGQGQEGEEVVLKNAQSMSDFTDADGNVYFDVWVPGTYTAFVDLNGNGTRDLGEPGKSVDIVTGPVSVNLVSCPEPGTVEGTAYNAQGGEHCVFDNGDLPYEGLMVELWKNIGGTLTKVDTATTDADGHYQFTADGLLPGEFELILTLNGASYPSDTFEVDPDETVTANFVVFGSHKWWCMPEN